MTSNIVVKVNRKTMDSFRQGEVRTVTLPVNPHWKRKLRNPNTGRYYPGLRVIVRSSEKEPPFVVSARCGGIEMEGGRFVLELKDIHILLPPFSYQLINEPRRNNIR